MKSILRENRREFLLAMACYFILILSVQYIYNYSNTDWTYIFSKTGRILIRLFLIQTAFLEVKDMISKKRNYLSNL